MIELINGDCIEYLTSKNWGGYNVCIVTDPPFNIGYHYRKYKDRMPDAEYYDFLKRVLNACESPYVVVHYPEQMYRLALHMNNAPEKVVSWVYNSNTRKQHRDIAFFGINPDMSKVKQPYKNPKDKRIQERIKNGSKGTNIYDWWNVNQVKNVSKEKTDHPCQMPLEVMKNVIGILPDDCLIIDPFMGSGTTGVACKELGKDFIGIELDEHYFEIASQRINGAVANE